MAKQLVWSVPTPLHQVPGSHGMVTHSIYEGRTGGEVSGTFHEPKNNKSWITEIKISFFRVKKIRK